MNRRSLFVLFAVLAVSVWGQSEQKLQVKRAKVVYVSGNDVVLKDTDGAVKHITVPKGFKFELDGKEVGVEDLKVGTELTQTIMTTAKSTTVTDVRKIDAKVWEVNAPYVIVTLPDGKNKRVKVPEGTKFNIGGEEKTVFDLRPGMQLTGTVVTKTPETIVSTTKSKVTGKSPAPTPALVGVLLIEEDVYTAR